MAKVTFTIQDEFTGQYAEYSNFLRGPGIEHHVEAFRCWLLAIGFAPETVNDWIDDAN